MLGGKLPELRSRDVNAFFREFATSHVRKGLLVTGVGAAGPFSIHLDHKGGLTQQQVRKALTYLGVSRARFMVWYADV